jgi:hypothetical protein
MITLDNIELPSNLYWIDETEWVPVEQPEPERGLDGSLLVEPATMIGGRPITLIGSEDYPAWISYQTGLYLLAMASVAGSTHTLTLNDGREFSVMFRYHDGKPVDISPIVVSMPILPDDDCWIALRLMEVII